MLLEFMSLTTLHDFPHPRLEASQFSRLCVEDISYCEKMATVKKIVVCGGNGFLGSRICKSAVARGWDVTSIR
jgi:hypothetical protein